MCLEQFALSKGEMRSCVDGNRALGRAPACPAADAASRTGGGSQADSVEADRLLPWELRGLSPPSLGREQLRYHARNTEVEPSRIPYTVWYETVTQNGGKV